MPDPSPWSEPLRPRAWDEGPPETREPEHYVLRLYVCGMSARSQNAIRSLREVCERHLANCYEFEVINLTEHPELAQQEQIIASPTLIKERPLPARRIVGDFSQEEKVVAGLGIPPTLPDPPAAPDGTCP